MFRPKHTFQSVLEQLIAGLEAGSITVGAATDSAGKEKEGHVPASPGSDGKKCRPGQRIEQPEKGTAAE